MSCGLEHLSNCHGELTIASTMLASVALWFRLGWTRIKCCFTKNKNSTSCSIHQLNKSTYKNDEDYGVDKKNE